MAFIKGRNVRGAVAEYETHRHRLVDARGGNVIVHKLSSPELNVTTVNPTGWTTTVVEIGTGTSEFNPGDEIDVVGILLTAADENDGINVQLVGESFKFDSNHDIYFGMEFRCNDVDQMDFWAGLGITDTTLLAAVTDAVYFETLDGSAALALVAEKNNTETTVAAVGTLVDDTDIFIEFYWNGTTLYAYVDGLIVSATVPANIPDDEELRLSMHFLTGEDVAQTLKIKRLVAIQIGD